MHLFIKFGLECHIQSHVNGIIMHHNVVQMGYTHALQHGGIIMLLGNFQQNF